MGDSLNIGYNDKGLDPTSMDESKEVIKETYKALKKKNKFFEFQLNFMPMRGVCKKTFETDASAIFRNANYCQKFEFSGFTYYSPKYGYKGLILRTPILRKMCLLDQMLRRTSIFEDPLGVVKARLAYMSKIDVMTAYLEHYYDEYRKSHKIKINELTFSWIFAIIFTFIYYAIIMWILSSIFPSIGNSLLHIHIMVLISFIIYFMINKF